MINDIITYFNQNGLAYGQAVWEHLYLSFSAFLICILLGLPVGYLAHRMKWLNVVSQGVVYALRVIPSLAVLFILIPYTGVGFYPALIALVVLGLPPILLNTILGFKQVDEVVVESGIALGMTQKDLLKKVQLPLALPYILNGMKLSLIEILASATLATYIGAGGLGKIIFTGLGLYRVDLLVIGGVSVMLLSCLSMIVFQIIIKRGTYHEH
ncbi:ABC transporter permease [Carnobacteriaceae bacterium zg-C25]|nr:ABC transporter permease [Carnobacteriaceae bacterium zg-C25]